MLPFACPATRLTPSRALGATLVFFALAALSGCVDRAPVAPGMARGAPPAVSSVAAGGRFVILGADGVLPANLEASVSAAGGALERVFPEIGVAFVSSSDAGFAAAASVIPGVESVTGDVALQWAGSDTRVAEVTLEATAVAPPPAPQVASIADDEGFYSYQWAPGAIQAPEAWNAGHRGQGVRVAIIDGGLYARHIDLSAGVDVAASRSFVPGVAFDQDVGTFWHGTHVAGIVGARDNSVGVIGIAPEATLIGIKVMHADRGNFSWVIDGLLYASRPRAEGGAGAQVINVSLGAVVDEKDAALKAAVKELSKAVDRAARYANDHGAIVIASAGNGGIDFDASKTLVSLPAMSSRVLGISATGPTGWAHGNRDFSRPASYTNFGKAIVAFAAPGGDYAYASNQLCWVGFIPGVCWSFDMYLSTTRGFTDPGGLTWAAGTSMASPVVAGVAALIIEANGGTMSPSLVAAKLRAGAIDLGKAGNDEIYGQGWVNAYNSVR